jgi:hypothetical protein
LSGSCDLLVVDVDHPDAERLGDEMFTRDSSWPRRCLTRIGALDEFGRALSHD